VSPEKSRLFFLTMRDRGINLAFHEQPLPDEVTAVAFVNDL
jgi:hypothetical protein